MKRRTFLTSLSTSAALLSTAALLQAEETAAEEKPAAALSLWMLPNKTYSQMMSFILKANDGSVIVIDGGTAGDAEYLFEQIKRANPDGHVAAWYLSHLHCDHVGALEQLMKTHREELTIDTLYFNFPELAWFDKMSKGEVKEAKDFYDVYDLLPHHETPQPGQTWTFGDVTIECLNDYDPEIIPNGVNNSSILYRVTTPKTSILFLGDLGREGGDRVTKLVAPEKLKADYVQMAHHGQNGVKREFYDLVKPSACFWCAPDWLWNNWAQPGKDDSGPFKTVVNRGWMCELGVREHYVLKDGQAELELE